jgi:hypothetical protein
MSKTHCTYFNLNTLLLKNANHHLSSQQVVIILRMEGLSSMLMAAD